MSTSPLVLRVRVARQLHALMNREGAKEINQAELARSSRLTRQTVYRHLTPTLNLDRRCNPVHVSQMASALGLSGQAHDRLVKTALAAATPEWWDTRANARIGSDQRTFANLAHGASHIREYQSHVIGGLAQTDEYARHRAKVLGHDEATVEGVVLGRQRRRERLLDPDVSYTLLVEELALRRLIAPPKVMIEQLEYLLELAQMPRVKILVLPIEPDVPEEGGAVLAEAYAPQAPFLLYDYHDAPSNPEIAVIDSIILKDHILIDRDAVDLHAGLFERLVSVALSDAKSATYIQEVADRMRSARL